jgi:hypothetical protein
MTNEVRRTLLFGQIKRHSDRLLAGRAPELKYVFMPKNGTCSGAGATFGSAAAGAPITSSMCTMPVSAMIRS